jgi:hypothetical protein
MDLISQIATTKEQSKELVKMGLDAKTADMFWDVEDGVLYSMQIPTSKETDKTSVDISFGDWSEAEPRWSLHKLMCITAKMLEEKYGMILAIESHVNFGWKVTVKSLSGKGIALEGISLGVGNLMEAIYTILILALDNKIS